MRFLLPLVLLAASRLPAVEMVSGKDGKPITYESIELDPKTPKTALLLRNGSTVTTLKLSDIDTKTLPEAQRDQLADFTKKQNADGLILLDDEWINRDEHLLKLDKRFTYEKKLHRGGRNVIKVENPQKVRVTLGLRGMGNGLTNDKNNNEGKGLEFSVEPGKVKTLSGIPDGEFYYYFLFETDDDTKLKVLKTSSVKLENTVYTLTMKESSEGTLKVEDAGTIDVPPEMRYKR
jgi:hypothetical protein